MFDSAAYNYHPSVQTVRQLDNTLHDPTLISYCEYGLTDGGPAIIPGLLQSEEMAAELLAVRFPPRPAEVNDIVTKARPERLSLVSRPAVAAEVFIAEGVSRAEDLDTGVLVRALGNIIRISETGNVTVRMIEDGALGRDERLQGMVDFIMTESLDPHGYPLRVVRLDDAEVTAHLRSEQYARAADWHAGLQDMALSSKDTRTYLHDEIRRLDPAGEHRQE